MMQPLTSDAQREQKRSKLTESSARRLQNMSSSLPPAIVHPNFDPKQIPLDPARPLIDIPEPARHVNRQLRRFYGKSSKFTQPKAASLSKWQLMASAAFSEHLALLTAAKLIDLPAHFYHNNSTQPLLSTLAPMVLLDMPDIQRVICRYPTLTRYGFVRADSATQVDTPQATESQCKPQCKSQSLRAVIRHYDPDELLNSLYADDWQVVLQPQDFDTGAGSLVTDIMACSVAVHALKQCATRKSINYSYRAEQICHYVRSYLLSQMNEAPASSYQYRQIRLFTGHIIVAACYLGWDIQVSDDGACYFNISSRCGLLTRYANMSDYTINGWSN